MTLEARFVSKVDNYGSDGCWLWSAFVDRNGYGRFSVNRRSLLAHRWAYQALIGPIPDGLTLDHTCRVRQCVNPGHLEPVSAAENTLRGEGICAQFARRDSCRRGHLFDEQNTSIRSDGGRRCRECKRIDQRNRNRERRAA